MKILGMLLFFAGFYCWFYEPPPQPPMWGIVKKNGSTVTISRNALFWTPHRDGLNYLEFISEIAFEGKPITLEQAKAAGYTFDMINCEWADLPRLGGLRP